MQIDQDSQSLSALSFALYALETEIEGLGDLFQPAAEIRAVRSAERAQVCLPCLAGQVDVRTAVGFHLERAVAVPVLERPRETPCRGVKLGRDNPSLQCRSLGIPAAAPENHSPAAASLPAARCR